ALALAASPLRAGTITLNAYNNNTSATVHFDDGSNLPGHNGTANLLLAQSFAPYAPGSVTPTTSTTFAIHLFHTASIAQTYAVNPRTDLAGAFSNGARMAYICLQYGTQDLRSSPIQAAAVQIALWDLSLNNHNPATFALDGGTYDSGDPNVFNVDLGNN